MQLFFVPNSDPSTSSVLDIYVSAANGNDANSGASSAAPVQTLSRAWELVPDTIEENVRIHLGSGDYTWVSPKVPQISNGARVYLVGDGAGQTGDDGFTSIVSGVAGGGTTTTALTLAVAGLANEYWGLTLITNNAYTCISRNTTTVATLNAAVTGLNAGDAYEIAQPGARINITRSVSPALYEDPNTVTGFDGLFFVNVVFEGQGVDAASTYVSITDSFVGCYGVLFNPGAFNFINCRVEMGSYYAQAKVIADLGWTVTSLAGWGVSNKNDGTNAYYTFLFFQGSTTDRNDIHYINSMFLWTYNSSLYRIGGSSYWGAYINHSTIYLNPFGSLPFFGVDSYIQARSSYFDAIGVTSTESTWFGDAMQLQNSSCYFDGLNLTGSARAYTQYGGEVQITNFSYNASTFTATAQTNDAIRLYGGLLRLEVPTTVTGQIHAMSNGSIITSAALTITGGLRADGGGNIELGANATVNASAATTAVRLYNEGSLILTNGTLTLTAGANTALDLRTGSVLALNGGSLTASSTSANYTAFVHGSQVDVASGTLTLPNTGGGVGLHIDAGSSFSQSGGTSSISTNTNASGACIVRGASNLGVSAGTFTATAGTGNGAGLRCWEASRAAFAISPTLTGGSGGTGVGLNVRGGGYVTLANDPTAGITGSGGAINVTGAGAVVGALSGSFGAVVDATTLTGIARSA